MCGYDTTAVTNQAAMWVRETDGAFWDALPDLSAGLRAHTC